MHQEVLNFLACARQRFGDLKNLHVLELGSQDVNGSPRGIFSGCAKYVGVDRIAGRGVDIISDCRSFDGHKFFNICICCESLEHDPDPMAFINAAERSLCAGGTLLLTAAAPPRAPHSCGGLATLNGEYYTNIFPEHLKLLLRDWHQVEVQYNAAHGDVYAIANCPR